jgi:hypothetical protein
MSWFRLDDKFHGNPKVMAAGNAAVGLWIRCATYCADHLTDGKVPKNLAKTYGKLVEIRALLDAGMWVETDTHYVMPDYLDYNPSRQRVVGEREEAKARMAARRSGNVRANIGGTSGSVRAPRPDPIPNNPPTPRRTEVLDAYLRIGRERATGPIRSEAGFAKHMLQSVDGESLARWLELFPTAPADAVAGWLHGDKGSMRYYPRVDELAPVTELRRNG